MNTVVWVYGGSAAGKKTFIETISLHENLELINRLGWEGKQVAVCQESLDLIAQFEGDPIIEKRQSIPEIVSKLNQKYTNAIILIKGQDVDLKAKRLIKTRELIPDAGHKIVFMSVPFEELYERTTRQSWWEDSDTQEVVKGWLDYQITELKKLKDDFEIQIIDGSAGGGYKFLSDFE
ncbi:MAG TPA: hypothetical protein VGE63_00450 [Candidatus Paceibacterota bacterium]